MSIPLITRLVLLFTVCLLSADVVDAAKTQAVTEDPFITRSLSTNTMSFRQILLDAFRQLLAAPMKIMKTLIQEITQFLKARDFRELYDMDVLKQIFAKAPKRLFAYYDALVGLEHNCMKRTVCDVAEYAARRIPKWLEQIAFIYFNHFAESKPYFEVIVHGITVKNCAVLYTECDPEQFIDRLRSNITTSIATTVAPISAALNNINDSLDNPKRPMTQAQRIEADLMKQLEEVQQQKSELIHQQQMFAQQQQMMAQQSQRQRLPIERPRPQESDEDFEEPRRRFPAPQASRRH